MGHSYSRLSIRKRSSDTAPHRQSSDREQPNKRSRLAQTSELDQPDPSQAVHQQQARTSPLRECEDDEEDHEQSAGYSSQQVFLSHSGKQKNFVEQLFTDLRRENIISFFDKDPDSLPKGEEFPPLIFRAAEKCRVAVVVLSEDFITSKWPMLELCAFFDAKETSNPSLKILPLFFEMSLVELSEKIANKDAYTSWVISKNPQTIRDTRIDLNAWFEALKALKRTSGEIYNRVEGEVDYRRKIVDAIRRLLQPTLVYEDPFVKGKQRVCQVVENLFDHTPYGENRVKIAGLHGAGGSGKTTLCKSLCNFFSHEFKGKVFHVELGRDCIETFKRALQVLAGASDTLVNSVMSIEHGSCLLKEMMRGKKVFLAIDNISGTSESIKESKLYLNAVCSGYESRILLTARSLGILRRLIAKEETSFMHVPGLEEEEAMAVLLQLTPVQVSRLTCVEKEVARKCIQKCRFRWYCGDGKEYLAYHPLVLKTFGAYLYDKFESSADLSRWIDIPNLSNTRMGPLQEIFSMFEESLRGLSPEYLTVFMLLCLFLPEPHMPYDSVLAWLAIVCDRSPEEIEYVIIQLKNKGFIEKGYKLYIHDLFMDFAQSHANGTGKWILLKNADEIPVRLQQPLPNDRSRFEAMKLDNCLFQSLAGINYDLLSNVSVLHLQDVAILRTLDLRPTKMVRSLAIIDCCQLEEIQGIEGLSALSYFIVKGCYTDLQLPGVECLMSLRHLEVHLEDSNQKSLKRFTQWLPPLGIGDLPKCDLLQYPKLRGLRNLRTVDLVYAGRGTGVLDFAGCSNLDTIQLSRCGMTGLLLTGCSQVRMFNLHFCDKLTAPVHFDELTALQTLRLSQFHMALPNLDVCTGLTTLALTVSDLEELPCIGGLTHLSTLWLSAMGKLKKLPSLSQLSNLRLLLLEGMRNLEELPTFSGLTNLCDLVLSGMPNLKELPSFTELTNLSQIGLEGMKSLMELPCIGGLTHLSRLWLLEMGKLKKLPSLSQLSNLSNLLLEGMPNLKELPTFSGLTNLCDLSLRGMPNLKELPSFTEFSNLSRLTLDGMKSLMELPIGLGSLTNLKSVELKGMPNLEELPTATNLCNLDLRGMPNLKELPCIGGLTHSSTLWLSEREKLKKLPSVSQLSNLLDLRLDGMPNLEELPTFSALTNLRHLVLRGMPSLKELPSFTELTKLELLILEGMKSLMELPISLGSLTNLRSLALEGMPNLTELPKLSGLTNLNELRLHEMDSLRELPSLGALTPLSLLSLRGMPSLTELPSFTGFTNLIHLRILKMQNLQGLPCLSGLTDLFELALAGMPSLKELPSLDGLSSLDSLVLEGMRNLEEIPSFRGLANLSSLEMGSMQSLKKLPTLSGLTGLGRFEIEEHAAVGRAC